MKRQSTEQIIALAANYANMTNAIDQTQSAISKIRTNDFLSALSEDERELMQKFESMLRLAKTRFSQYEALNFVKNLNK